VNDSDKENKTSSQSLEDSIEGLKAMLREDSDLTDDTIEHETPDSVLSSFASHRAREAVDMARKGLAADPASTRLKDWLAFNLYAANKVKEAIVLYRELLAVHDDNPEQHYYLGNCYYKSGRFSDAITEWKRVVELKSESHYGRKALTRLRKVQRKLFEMHAT